MHTEFQSKVHIHVLLIYKVGIQTTEVINQTRYINNGSSITYLSIEIHSLAFFSLNAKVEMFHRNMFYQLNTIIHILSCLSHIDLNFI